MIIKNQCVSQKDSAKIKADLEDNYFPWFYIGNATKHAFPPWEFNPKDYTHANILRHMFLLNYKTNSEKIATIIPILNSIKQILGDVEYEYISANLQMPNPANAGKIDYPHIDRHYDEEYYEKYDIYSGIYYVNTCDGDSTIYNRSNDGSIQTKISPEEGKLVLFDTRTYHSLPSGTIQHRMIINLNFRKLK